MTCVQFFLGRTLAKLVMSMFCWESFASVRLLMLLQSSRCACVCQPALFLSSTLLLPFNAAPTSTTSHSFFFLFFSTSSVYLRQGDLTSSLRCVCDTQKGSASPSNGKLRTFSVFLHVSKRDDLASTKPHNNDVFSLPAFLSNEIQTS